MPQDKLTDTLTKKAYKDQEVIIPRPARMEAASMEEVLAAIPGSGGTLKTIAARVGCHLSTISRYRRDYPQIAEAIYWEQESRKDYAEDMVQHHIENGSQIMTMFYLKTRAKDRGWVESSTDVEYLVKQELRRYLTFLQERLEPDVFEAVVNATRLFKTVDGTVVGESGP